MSDHSTKRVWICPEDASTYLIPADANLPEGSTTLVSFNGDELAVDAKAIQAYQVEEEDAHTYLFDKAESAFDSVKDMGPQNPDAWDGSEESEIAQIFASILNDKPSQVFSENDRNQLQKKIESGELKAAFEELSEDMGEILEKLGQSTATTIEEIFSELMELASKRSAKPQDWQQLKDRIKTSLDKKLQEDVLKNGFPKDYTQL